MTSQNMSCSIDFEQTEPWSLSNFPNYAEALPVDFVDANTINFNEFQERFVNLNRPCILRGAVRHWPAYRQWGSIDYLKKKVPDVKVFARNGVIPEHAGDVSKKMRIKLIERFRSCMEETTFHSFLDRATSSSKQWVMHSVPITQRSGLLALVDDLGTFSFMQKYDKPRLYTAIRAFFYRHSYTDWHYHMTDEALMIQVVGKKQVLLLPPDQATWDVLLPVIRETGRVFQVDGTRFPKFQELRPLKVDVEEGDALFIPTYWWHAVASTDDKFGVTVALTFPTPLHVNGNWRLPATKRMVKRFWFTRRLGPTIFRALFHTALRKLGNEMRRS